MQKVQGLALQFNVGKKMKRKKVGASVKREKIMRKIFKTLREHSFKFHIVFQPQ